jgi:RNA-binding protein
MSGLGGKARRHLRALGHHLKPVVLAGKDGITDALCAATDTALEDHELIKVKLGENASGDRHDLCEELAARSRSELIGVVGRTALLYRRHPKQPKLLITGDKSAKQKMKTAARRPKR